MRQDFSYHALNEETVVSARSIKKSTGTYYTPQHLADLISRDSLLAWLSERTNRPLKGLSDLNSLSVDERLMLIKKIHKIRIMDPSVGEGVFLLASANLLNEILTTLGDDRTENQRRRAIVTNNLYGVDLSSHGARVSSTELCEWASANNAPNIRMGNSLLGFIRAPEDRVDLDFIMIQKMGKKNGSSLIDELEKTTSFHWSSQYPLIFSGLNKGFDIILGNPPYGNILGMLERSHITASYPFNVGKNRTGTWNSAAHFIVRAASLLKNGGQLGFLVPNSILRVKQFTKTREFILNHLELWKIVDEGSPFEGVTLEMVSLFLRKGERLQNKSVQIESRRSGIKKTNVVDFTVLKKANVFPIYYDDFFKNIIERGVRNQLVATRGRDIPKKHTRKQHEEGYDIPYITSGRSVHRYRINESYVTYTNDWLFQDHMLSESFENELLVAT
ncbi:MAG: Eco57I restriction-modification methylase domain-containing protein, partial [Candidatus Thorarchaeota archaeon]